MLFRRVYIAIIVFFSCLSGMAFKGKYPGEVLSHYSAEKDSLKKKAAEFLLKNMIYHHSVSSPLLDMYYENMARINKQCKYPQCLEYYDSLYQHLGQPKDCLHQMDTDVIDAQTLIAHVDAAYDCWKNGFWAKHLTFDEFCEYLLPYRVGNEKYESWRDMLRLKYLPSTDQNMINYGVIQ